MSNIIVGTIYQKIIDDVIENCVITFEEDGVERKLLDEVKKTWQSKLSERKVATMPWDPAPAPISAPQANSQASPMPSQASQPDTKPPAHFGNSQTSSAAATASSSTVKAEPGTSNNSNYDLHALPQANGVGGASYTSSSGAALDRTSQQLHDKFGAAAGPQISQLQARRAMMSQTTQGQAAQGQGQGQQAGTSPADLEQKRRMYEQQQAQRHKAQIAAQQRAVGSAQTDGAGDWDTFVAARRAAVVADGGAADSSLRELLDASTLEMEGGGLLAPVGQRAQRASKARRARVEHGSGSANAPYQLDGPDDDSDVKDEEDEDEDAINSDLDDSDDGLEREETDEDANQGEIMLCTYDKVQRVKNKWKCTLKDGVLTTGGKEYVFHKANGDFEW